MHAEGGPAALVMVDLQNDFLHPDGAFARRGAARASTAQRSTHLARVRAILAASRRAGLAIIWVNTALRADLADVGFSRRFQETTHLSRSAPYLVAGSWGAEIVQGLEPEPEDIQLRKSGSSAFHGTVLDRLLANLGIRSCVLVGGCDRDGLADTARQGAALGYDLVIASDAILTQHAAAGTTWGAKTARRETTEAIVRLLSTETSGSQLSTHPSRTALLVVDMQNHYVSPEGFKARHGWSSDDDDDRHTLVANTQRLVEWARRRGHRIVFLVTLGRPDGIDRAWARAVIDQVRPLPAGEDFLAEGTWDAEIVPELTPGADDVLIVKKGSSGFGFTPLHRVLRNLDVTACVVAGGSAHGCLEATWREGVALGYDVTVVADATYPVGRFDPSLVQDWVRVRSTAETTRL